MSPSGDVMLATTKTSVPARSPNVTPLDWRDSLDLANELANVEGFVPKALLGRPPAILATILAGAELGLGPIVSLRSIWIIEGKTTLSAEVARALVYAAGHELRIEATDTQAIARGRRRGETDWTTVEWTLDRARRARLADKAVWRQYPRAMLVARASSELAHMKFADVLAGLDIAETFVEPGDELPEPPKRARRSLAMPTQAQDRPLEGSLPSSAPTRPPSSPEPPLPGEDGFLEEAPDTEPLPSETELDLPRSAADVVELRSGLNQLQLRRLHARMAETFPNADRVALDRIRHALVVIVTRSRPDGPVSSSSDLTPEELDRLDRRLDWVRNGAILVGERPDGIIEFRQGPNVFAVNPELRTVEESVEG